MPSAYDRLTLHFPSLIHDMRFRKTISASLLLLHLRTTTTKATIRGVVLCNSYTIGFPPGHGDNLRA